MLQLRSPLQAQVVQWLVARGDTVRAGDVVVILEAMKMEHEVEFGGMGLEGAVRLGYRKELEAVPEGPEREALFDRLLASQYASGQAMNMAATLEIDAVIDPAETRAWLARGLAAARVGDPGGVAAIDTW